MLGLSENLDNQNDLCKRFDINMVTDANTLVNLYNTKNNNSGQEPLGNLRGIMKSICDSSLTNPSINFEDFFNNLTIATYTNDLTTTQLINALNQYECTTNVVTQEFYLSSAQTVLSTDNAYIFDIALPRDCDFARNFRVEHTPGIIDAKILVHNMNSFAEINIENFTHIISNSPYTSVKLRVYLSTSQPLPTSIKLLKNRYFLKNGTRKTMAQTHFSVYCGNAVCYYKDLMMTPIQYV